MPQAARPARKTSRIVTLLVKTGLFGTRVRPATNAEMALRLDALINQRISKTILPPDFLAAFLNSAVKFNRKMMSSWCAAIGWLNLPAMYFDSQMLPHAILPYILGFRLAISALFLGAALLVRRISPGWEPLLLLPPCMITLVLAGTAGLMTHSGRLFESYMLMAVMINCTGIIFLPLEIATTTCLAVLTLLVMSGYIFNAAIPTIAEKSELVLFYGSVLAALTKARQVQNLYLHRLFLLKSRDEMRNLDVTRRNEMLSSFAYTDPLTNIPNRRFFHETLEALAAAPADSLPLTLCMIDADHFKNLNDKLGHAQGDLGLQAIANIIRAQLRQPGDILARYGGEEFIILLPRTELGQGLEIIERIRAAILDLNLANPGTALGRVSISAGISVAFRPSEIATLTREADRALYRAKSNGRNRVEL